MNLYKGRTRPLFVPTKAVKQRSRPINKSGDEPSLGIYATRSMRLSVTNRTGIRMRRLKLDGVRVTKLSS